MVSWQDGATILNFVGVKMIALTKRALVECETILRRCEGRKPCRNKDMKCLSVGGLQEEEDVQEVINIGSLCKYIKTILKL